MDHLALPNNCRTHWKVGLFARSRTYRPGDFFTLPRTFGFTSLSALRQDGLPPTIDRSAANEFLQSWLFFSLLSLFLDRDVDISTFIEPEDRALHTRNLPQLLEEWMSREEEAVSQAGAIESVAISFAVRHGKIFEALNIARSFVSQHLASQSTLMRPCSSCKTRGIAQVENATIKKLDQRALIALAVLGETLKQTLSDSRLCLKKRPGSLVLEIETGRWGHNALLQEELMRHGCCPKHVHEVCRTETSSALYYYVRSLEGRENTPGVKIHENCTICRCTARKIELPPLHFETCNGGCRTHYLEAQNRSIENWIKEGLTPLVTWDDERGLQARPYNLAEDKVVFAALSHSWGEGIVTCGRDARGGNNRKMHECQIKVLQKTFNSICRGNSGAHFTNKRANAIPFWVDVLCMPRERSTKALAVNQLSDIYRHASKVLVWDRQLIEASRQSNSLDIGVRVKFGNWVRRLWALQETLLAKDLQFWVHGGESIGLKSLQSAASTALVDREHPSHFCWTVISPFSPPVWRLRSSQKPGAATLRDLWEALQNHEIDRPEDEVIVMGNILGLNVSRLQETSPYEDILDARMKAFLRMLDEDEKFGIPADIIFFQQERRKLPGWSWAPRRWTEECSNVDPQCDLAQLAPRAQRAVVGKTGLLVSFPGLVIHRPTNLQSHLDPAVPQRIDARMHCYQKSVNEWYQIILEVHELPEESDCAEITPSDGYAMILSAEPQRTWTVALYVRFLRKRTPGNPIHVQRLCRAWIRIETYPNNLDRLQKDVPHNGRVKDHAVVVESFPQDQRWSIGDGSTKELLSKL